MKGVCQMNLEEVRQQCIECGMCALSETGGPAVAGYGPADAEVMYVDEYPEGEDSEERGPLTGECGKLLQCYLDVIGLSREKNLYITTLVKCKPPANRRPLQEERDVCVQLLRKEFSFIRPRIVICAGRVVCKALIKGDYSPAKDSGIFFHKGKTIFVGVPRTFDLLRSSQNKAYAFKYYAAIRARIGVVCEYTYEPGFLLSCDEKKALRNKLTDSEERITQLTLV